MSHRHSPPHFFLLVLPALACGSGGTQSVAPTTGTLEIDISTTGAEPDPDGYSLQLDAEAAQAISSAAQLRHTGVVAGLHTIQLGGVASNCTVSGDNPRMVTITAEDTIRVSFAVTCESTVTSVIEWLWSAGFEVGNPLDTSFTHPGGSVLRTAERAFSGTYSLKFTTPPRVTRSASGGVVFAFAEEIHVVDLWFYLPVGEGTSLEFEVALEGWSATQQHLASFQWVRNDALKLLGWRRWVGGDGDWVYLPGGAGRTLSEGEWHHVRCEVDYGRREYRMLTIDGTSFHLDGLPYDVSPSAGQASAFHVSILLWTKAPRSVSAFVDDIRVGKVVLRKG